MTSKSKQPVFGTCHLTGEEGPFVASHLIPKALTRLSRTGEKYIETEIGGSIKKRADSWYDTKLVTQKGEDILSDIDSNGINELRKYRLVWSGWKGRARLDDEFPESAPQPTVRLVKISEPGALMLFFQSLLWRAAASSLSEFKEIVLSPDVLEDLRLRVFHKHPGSPGDYPVQLHQLISKGPEHNRTPLLEYKPIPISATENGPEVPYVRFYFDGLVAHIHLPTVMPLGEAYLKTCLGVLPELIVFAHEARQSRAFDNILEMMADAEARGGLAARHQKLSRY